MVFTHINSFIDCVKFSKANTSSRWARRTAQLAAENQTLKAANRELEQALRQLQQAQSQLIETEIKLAKAETLQQSEDRFRSLLQNASNIIATLQADGQVLYISPSVTHILGHSPSDWATKNLSELVHPDDCFAAEDLVRYVVQEPLLQTTAEFRLYHADGSWRDFEAIAKNLLSEPNVAGIVITCRDITERKQAEAEVHKALEKERELSELKSRFISMASHEFRTPLAVMSSSLGILEDYGDRLDAQQSQKQLQHVQKSIRHITQLLDDVLMINRAEAGKIKLTRSLVNVSQFCRTLMEEIQLSSPQYKLVFSTTDTQNLESSGYARLDEKLLRSILANLLANAIKYSVEGGTIYFNLTYQPQEIVFQVQDEGIGIPQDDQEHLFEPFHRAKNVGNIPGTGLGLSIVQRCVDLHGGSITVHSQVAVGSIFTVSLPVKRVESVYQQSEQDGLILGVV